MNYDKMNLFYNFFCLTDLPNTCFFKVNANFFIFNIYLFPLDIENINHKIASSSLKISRFFMNLNLRQDLFQEIIY